MTSVDMTDLRMGLGISVLAGEVALMLVESKVVTTADLQERNVPQPRKVMHKLREKLGDLDVELKSHRRLGYWLEDDAKERLIRLCTHDASNTTMNDDNEPEVE